MTQNEINKEIRIIIIQLFGDRFIEAVDSFDKYRSVLRENILISEYESIKKNNIVLENFKEE